VYDMKMTAVRFLTAMPESAEDPVLQSTSLEYEYLGKHIPSTIICGIARGEVHPLLWRPYGDLSMSKALVAQIVNARNEALATKRRRGDFFVEMTQVEKPSDSSKPNHDSFVVLSKKPRTISIQAAPVPVSLDVDISRIQAMYEFESETDFASQDDNFNPGLTEPLKRCSSSTLAPTLSSQLLQSKSCPAAQPATQSRSTSSTCSTPARTNPFVVRSNDRAKPSASRLFSALLGSKPKKSTKT